MPGQSQGNEEGPAETVVKKMPKKCRHCQYHYNHGDLHWCLSKKCPSKYPERVRPPYRPGIEARKHGYPQRDEEVKPFLGAIFPWSGLPIFPEFNSPWSFPVQEKWLECYVQLREIEAKYSNEKT